MKKLIVLLVMAITSLASYGQINFEKGYYITNTDEKIDGFIKNMDWDNNPTEFEFKATASSVVVLETIKTVKEFGVYNFSKFVRTTVNMDRSSDNLERMTTDKQPVFNEEELFLKVVVQGKATLYEFAANNLRRYFFSDEDAKTEQLIYKRYRSDSKTISKNNSYKQQLFNSLKCATINMNRINNVDYARNDLSKVFVEYNQCNNPNAAVVNFAEKQKRDFFHLTIRPGFNNSSLSVSNPLVYYKGAEFDTKWSFRLGIEAEFILPFNKDKWSLFFEPTYQSYQAERKIMASNPAANLTGEADYSSIEVPLGIRHYFFLNDDSKIFVNAAVVLDFSSNSTVIFTRDSGTIQDNLDASKTKNNYAIGLGYKFKNRYSLEFRYLTSREILGKYVFWSSDYKTVSVILGYSIF